MTATKYELRNANTATRTKECTRRFKDKSKLAKSQFTDEVEVEHSGVLSWLPNL